MSHEIDQSTGKTAVFVTGEPPWHGLGTVIKQAATSQEAIVLAGLNWEVEQWPLITSRGGEMKPIVNHLANVRADTQRVLGVVSRRYRLFQNAEAFDFMDALVGEKLAMFETAGSLADGRRIWLLARLPGEYRAAADDVVKPYVLLTNNHDGSGPLRMVPTTIRVVCQNTLLLALGEAGQTGVTIRHAGDLATRVAEARQKLGIISQRMQRFADELQLLSTAPVRSSSLEEYFRHLSSRAVAPISDTRKAGQPQIDLIRRRREDVLRQWHENFEHPTNALTGMRHTWWGAYNAISQWTDHQKPYRGRGIHARRENRLNSIWFGESDRLKQLAFESARSLAQNYQMN